MLKNDVANYRFLPAAGCPWNYLGQLRYLRGPKPGHLSAHDNCHDTYGATILISPHLWRANTDLTTLWRANTDLTKPMARQC